MTAINNVSAVLRDNLGTDFVLDFMSKKINIGIDNKTIVRDELGRLTVKESGGKNNSLNNIVFVGIDQDFSLKSNKDTGQVVMNDSTIVTTLNIKNGFYLGSLGIQTPLIIRDKYVYNIQEVTPYYSSNSNLDDYIQKKLNERLIGKLNDICDYDFIFDRSALEEVFPGENKSDRDLLIFEYRNLVSGGNHDKTQDASLVIKPKVLTDDNNQDCWGRPSDNRPLLLGVVFYMNLTEIGSIWSGMNLGFPFNISNS